jgi:SSS family solute:Na+ symporter
VLNHWQIVPVFVIGFLLVSVYLGVRAGRGRIHTTADHVVGGRSLGFFLIFFVSVGEIFSSVAFLGQPGWAYQHGAGMLLPVGTLIPLMAFWLGPKIWEAGRARGLITQAQFFGSIYQSDALRGCAAVFALVGLVAYLAAQMMGGGYILSVTTQGRIPYWLGALLAFGVMAIYVYIGGLRGISWVAVLKGVFMAGVGVYVVVRVVRHFFGGINGLFTQLAWRSPAHLTLPGPEGYVTYTFWTTSLLISLCAFYMWPHLFANFYSAESPRVIRRQAIFLPLYNFLVFLFMLVGFAGVLVVPSIKPDTVMVEVVMRIAPLWLVAFFCAGALSASMVTAAALGNDLLQPRLRWRDAELRRLIQVLIFLVIGVAYVVALLQPATIVFIILTAYGFNAQWFPAAVAAFYDRKVTAEGVLAGVAMGFAVVAFFVFGRVSPPYGIHPGCFGLGANIPVMLLISRFTGTVRGHNGA